MKKFSLVLLLIIYTLSIFGIGVKAFYCCGRMASVSIFFSSAKKENSDKGCCKTKFRYYKVRDSHVQPGETCKHVKSPEYPVSFGYPATQPLLSFAGKGYINNANSPPHKPHTPIYIFNCVYRI